eukprot:TRINITY_DN9976_c0_g1_i1.p1 TRINITY_DN9976_c0_g1~~TRINITY_DN9976_c0_g1_i1.p1  ORF type:complete len:327 (+),score=95.60 TRINITY_DN9976_c0_g1_i1:163-1143(+)
MSSDGRVAEPVPAGGGVKADAPAGGEVSTPPAHFKPSSALFMAPDDDSDDDSNDEYNRAPEAEEGATGAGTAAVKPGPTAGAAKKPAGGGVYKTHEEKLRAEEKLLDEFTWASSKDELVNDPERWQRLEEECKKPDPATGKGAPPSGDDALIRASRTSIEAHTRENTSDSTTLHVFGISSEDVREETIVEALQLPAGAVKARRWQSSREVYLTLASVGEVRKILSRGSDYGTFKVKMWDPAASRPSPSAVPVPQQRRGKPNIAAFGRVLKQVNSANSRHQREEAKRKDDLLKRHSEKLSEQPAPAAEVPAPVHIDPQSVQPDSAST